MQVSVSDLIDGNGGVYAVVAYTSGQDYLLPFYMYAGCKGLANFLKDAKYRVLERSPEKTEVRFVTVRLYKLYDILELAVLFKAYGINISVFMRILNTFSTKMGKFFNLNILGVDCDYADVTEYFNK